MGVWISAFTDDFGVFETTIVYSTNKHTTIVYSRRAEPGRGLQFCFLPTYFNQAIPRIFHPDPTRKIPAGSEEHHYLIVGRRPGILGHNWRSFSSKKGTHGGRTHFHYHYILSLSLGVWSLLPAFTLLDSQTLVLSL